MAAPAARRVAFLLGFGIAFLPSFGPFAAILFILTARLRFRKSDLLWLGAAILTAASLAVHAGVSGALFGVLQILGPWAVYRAFTQLHHPYFESFPRRVALQGLVAGFVVIVAFGFSSVRLNLAYPTITQAIVWGANPALFAHMVLAVGALIALLAGPGWQRPTVIALSALGVLAAGSLEAALGLLIVIGALTVMTVRGRRALPAAGLAIVGIVLAAVLVFGPALGIGRVGYLVDASAATAPTNLVRGSEVPSGDWWDAREVGVRATRTTIHGAPFTVYAVTKLGAPGWLRLQQVVPIRSGTSYTVSAWVLDRGEGQPGIQGWGQLRSGDRFTLTSELVAHRLVTNVTGPGVLEEQGIAATDGSWVRIYATFRYTGVAPSLDWYVGLAPDAREVDGTTASFAGFQLERGSLTGYRPGPAANGLGLTSGRLAMWRAAWEGIVQRPWLGWGAGSFARYFREAASATAPLPSDIPAHAHDLVLEVWFERGLVGLVGLALLIAGLAWAALRKRDVGFLVVLFAVLFANVFDYTFFFGGVVYPLAAVAGWRAGPREGDQPAADSFSRQFVVRLVLAAVDLGLAWAGLHLASWLVPRLGLSGPPPALHVGGLASYAVFLWPAMAWREGLYPGYGLTESDQLKRHVLTNLYAGTLFLVATFLVASDLVTDPAVVLIATSIGLVSLPMGRGSAKRLLRAVGLWGRPVVILGGGTLATGIARTLMFRSLDGLRPVAVFADDVPRDDYRRASVGGVPLIGPVSTANAFARREGIHHAIVAMDPGSRPLHLPKLDPANDAFRIVQYVPDLPGLPVLGVRAEPLDDLLALQVRNELASPLNRALKRSLDLAGVLLGGLLISPLLLGLGVAVVLDSRGPALFAHTRIGRNGRRIRVWKFRTMVDRAAEQLERHLAADPALRAEWEATHKLKDDPRVTRVGRFLRRYSLDELPQLWNVLIGEMSLVGPRPIVDDEVAKYRDAFDLYTMVRPGMTGYWQISGRSDTDYDQRVELDSFYVRNWSVWLDVIVLIKTASAVVKRDGAY